MGGWVGEVLTSDAQDEGKPSLVQVLVGWTIWG